MLQALLAGVASIKAHQTRMNVIGNNLANVNTTAFKGSRATFQDMISQVVRGGYGPTTAFGGQNPTQFGLGVLVAGTDTDTAQGSLNATNRRTDLAIQGNGFFVVSDGTTMRYTRDGAFDLDANGNLVMRGSGERVVGWTADASGNIDATTVAGATNYLTIPLGSLTSAQATSAVTLSGNLKSTSTNTDTWSTMIRVYDDLGGAHDVTIKFSNRTSPATGGPADATSSWDWEAFEGTTSLGSSSTTGNSKLFFDASGKLLNASALGKITVPGSGASAAFNIDLNFGSVSQLAADTQVQVSNQNGHAAGSLDSFAIGNDGTIVGIFTNGLTRNLGQVAMANFSNIAGLQREGNNLWRETNNSGLPMIGTAGTGGRGFMSAGFLEQSNVDIGQEFTDLIVTQRGFQANTKVVTTVDEMLQDLLAIKR